jgi:Na+/H+ antiporter NhaC
LKYKKKLSKYLGDKKGQVFSQLAALGTGIAALAITLIVVFLILSETKANSTVAADANATAAITELQKATDDIPGWVPLVVIAVIGAILLGLVSLFRNRG